MQAWEQFIKEQEKALGKKVVDQWLRPFEVVSFDACNLYLKAKDPFQIEWFEEHLKSFAEKKFLNNNKKPIHIHFHSNDSKTKKPEKKSKSEAFDSQELKEDTLNPEMTFETFISTQGNLLAFKLLTKIVNYDIVSKQYIPGAGDLTGFNPIYLFGSEGTGKTHLLQATASALKSQGLNVLCVRSKTFSEHVVSSIRSQSMNAFRKTYREADILLIDDVEYFARKNATQEELFHTFNSLHLEGKQIILTAKCPPQELQQIEPRLVSRFEWGIVLPLEPLNEENLKSLLKYKTEQAALSLPPKTENFLISAFHGNSSKIVRAIEALALRSHSDKKASKSFNVSSIQELLKDLLKEEEICAIQPEEIIQLVATQFEVEVSEILGKKQVRAISLPRHIAMYLCREKLKMPYTHIGRLFSRDHSTIMTNISQIQKSLDDRNQEVENVLHTLSKKVDEHERLQNHT